MSVVDIDLRKATEKCDEVLGHFGLAPESDEERQRLNDDVYHYLVNRAWSPFNRRLAIAERARLAIIEGALVGAPMVAGDIHPKRLSPLRGDLPAGKPKKTTKKKVAGKPKKTTKKKVAGKPKK